MEVCVTTSLGLMKWSLQRFDFVVLRIASKVRSSAAYATNSVSKFFLPVSFFRVRMLKLPKINTKGITEGENKLTMVFDPKIPENDKMNWTFDKETNPRR